MSDKQVVSVEFITKEIHHHLVVDCDVDGRADLFEIGSSSGFSPREGLIGKIVLDDGVTIIVLSHKE